jgi:phage-related minor tail protein
MLLDMIAQATAADLAARLFGPNGQGGGWLSELASVVGFAKGGAFSQGQPITAFADGGVLTRPTFFGMGGGRMGVAGEAGYEGVLPLRRGPNGRLGVEAYGGGGGGNLTINVAAGPTRGEMMAAIQLGVQTAEGNVMARLRRAGVL